MAEAAALALAVFSAFDNAVRCFECIQLARSFDRDLQSATLKLDVANLRLSRWGRSVGLSLPDSPMSINSGTSDSPKEYKQAEKLLLYIVDVFEEAQQRSNRYKTKGPVAEVADRPDSSLHRMLRSLALRHFKPADIVKKTRWVLYEEKHLRRLIEDVTEHINSLTSLFPATQGSQKQLCAEEGLELASDENVESLQPIVAEQDPILSASIKMNRQGGPQTLTVRFEGSTNYGLQQGYFSGTQSNNFGLRS